jgi:hypothetical protein
MTYLDTVERWIRQNTGRTLDQHATDPVPAAANLPASVSLLRHARSQLHLAVDELRTHLINGDDLTAPAKAMTWWLNDLTDYVRDYDSARTGVDTLIADPDRAAYVAANPVQTVRRRYVNPGDTVLIVLPHTDACRKAQLAGRSVRVRIKESNAELDPGGRPDPVRLPHIAAGIYRDPVESSLYILRPTTDERTGSEH